MRRVGRLLLAGTCVLAGAGSVSAQTPRIEGPFAGLFGGASRNRTVSQSLDVRGSLFGVWQDILEPPADQLRLLDPRFQKTGVFGGVSGAAAYGYQRAARRSSLFFGANAGATTFSSTPDLVIGNYSGMSGLTTNLTQKISFSATGMGGYSQFYNFGSNLGTLATPTVGNVPIISQGTLPFGGGQGAGFGSGFGIDQVLPGAAFGLGAFLEPNVILGGTSSLGMNVSSRTTLSAFSDYREFMLVRSNLRTDFWSSGVSVQHRIVRRLNARAGYQRFVNRIRGSNSQQFTQNGIVAGLDYGDAFRFNLGRRTTLTLAPTASISRWVNQTQFRVNGTATLSSSFGRTWMTSVSYVRDLGFLAGFGQPILSDSVMGSIGGGLGPRLRWTNLAGWMRGQIGFDAAAGFHWYVASSSLSVALAKPVGLFVQYAYTQASVPVGSSPVFTTPRIARQTVIAGLTAHAPIFSRRGRARP